MNNDKKHFKLFAIYVIIYMSASSVRKGVLHVDYILSFVVAIVARIAGYYICKWLDSRKNADK